VTYRIFGHARVVRIPDGRTVHYELTDPEILAACDLMRNVLMRRLSALGSLAAAARLDDDRRGADLGSRPMPMTQGNHR
jgi:hypothetical protein